MSFTPGGEIRLSEYASLPSNRCDLSGLLDYSFPELEAMKAESIKKENVIYQKIEAAISEWKKQAEDTQRLAKAMEYLRTPPVQHTSNQWTVTEFGRHERSNMVYKMTWSISEDKRRDWKTDTYTIVAWAVTWDVYYNTPRNPDYSGSGWKIAGQSGKRYTDKAELEKYLQGRISAYEHLFTELSPPIPKDQAGRFCVNGSLLPGYTVEQSRAETVDALLDCLEDEDLPPDEPVRQEKKEETPVTHKLHTVLRNERRNQEDARKSTSRKKPPEPVKRKKAPVR